jgi:DedD protein
VNHLLDTDTDPREDSHSARGSDHEISLGIPTILGIFFALALAFAAVFGFGYSLGRRSAPNAASTPTTLSTSPSLALKPAAGSLANQSNSHTPVVSEPTPAPATVAVPISQPKSAVAPSDTIIAGDKLPSSQPASSNSQPAISPTGTFVVQIAAVSSQEIADIEVAALKKYGYDVVVRHEPQDQLLHIQIGPYATRKDAEAMRANVQAHGFNAYIPK